jgi:hypothetical protein
MLRLQITLLGILLIISFVLTITLINLQSSPICQILDCHIGKTQHECNNSCFQLLRNGTLDIWFDICQLIVNIALLSPYITH